MQTPDDDYHKEVEHMDDEVLAGLGSVLGEHTHTLRLSDLCLAATSRADVQVWACVRVSAVAACAVMGHSV